jgi:hypothetical protein
VDRSQGGVALQDHDIACIHNKREC